MGSARHLTLADLPAPPAGRTGWPWTDDGGPPPRPVPGAPRISIVTPSFNQGRFIEETLRSVLLQNYPDLEYVVIDGGSTDETLDVLRRYAPFLSHWESERDRGQTHAINKGFARCTGAIVAWINSDDAFRPHVLHEVAAALEQASEAVLIYGRASDRDEHGRPMDRFKGFPFRLADLLEGYNPVAQPSAFFRRSALERIGPLDESLHYAMDHDLWLRLASVGKVVFVDRVWSDFRHYAESKSGTAWLPFLVDIDRVVERAFEEDWLPAELRGRRRAALGASRLNAGLACYWQERYREARTYGWRALSVDPRLLLDGGARADLLRCLLGSRWVRRFKPLGRALLRGRTRSLTPRADP